MRLLGDHIPGGVKGVVFLMSEKQNCIKDIGLKSFFFLFLNGFLSSLFFG